jgi:hypothetical protein
VEEAWKKALQQPLPAGPLVWPEVAEEAPATEESHSTMQEADAQEEGSRDTPSTPTATTDEVTPGGDARQ